MKFTRLIARAAAAAAVVAILVPASAQAQVIADPSLPNLFQCAPCTLTGQGGTSFSLEVLTAGWYQIYATGSANDQFNIFVGDQSTEYFLGSNQLGPTGQPLNLAVGTYQVTAEAICGPLGQACNLNIHRFDLVDAAPVPEPATMILLGTGLVGIMGVRRRRRLQEFEQA